MTRRPLVLVVDDQKLMRVMARESLREVGLRVVEAENGRDALERFERERPEVVLLDVTMPVLDGFETCRALRQLPEGRHTPILMMTGLDDVASIRRAYREGATDFINKPFNWLILGHRVEYMLRASRSAEALRDSQTRLSRAQAIASLGSWEWSAKTDELLCSAEMLRILGLGAEELGASLGDYLRRVHPEDRGTVELALQDLVHGEGGDPIEYRLVRPQGEPRYVHQI